VVINIPKSSETNRERDCELSVVCFSITTDEKDRGTCLQQANSLFLKGQFTVNRYLSSHLECFSSNLGCFGAGCLGDVSSFFPM